MIKVAFLFDPKNDWLRQHIPQSLVNRKDVNLELLYDSQDTESFEIVFVLGYTKILPKSFIEQNGLTLVVHESDLPKGKGFSPVQWQILEGKNNITVSLIELAQEVDSGDIFEQTEIKLDGSELYKDIRSAQANATFKLVEHFLDSYPLVDKRPQVGKSTFYRKRSLADGELNVDLSIREQFQLLRIGNNEGWPSFFYMDGKKYILKIYKEND